MNEGRQARRLANGGQGAASEGLCGWPPQGRPRARSATQPRCRNEGSRRPKCRQPPQRSRADVNAARRSACPSGRGGEEVRRCGQGAVRVGAGWPGAATADEGHRQRGTGSTSRASALRLLVRSFSARFPLAARSAGWVWSGATPLQTQNAPQGVNEPRGACYKDLKRSLRSLV